MRRLWYNKHKLDRDVLRMLMRIALAGLAAVAWTATAAGAAPLEVLRPADGETVPLLTVEQKSYLDLPRADRIAKFADEGYRKKMSGFGSSPAPVELAWRGGSGGAVFRPVQHFRLEHACPMEEPCR